MNKKETAIIVSRIEQWNNRLKDYFIEDRTALTSKYAWSKNAVPFSEKNKLKYKPISKGKSWGKEWDSAWFCLNGSIKKEWRGKKIIADLDFSGEGLVYDPKGKEIQGITNASIWDHNFVRTRVLIPKTCIKNNEVEIWVETAANSLFGIFVDVDPEQDNPKRHGTFDAKVETIDIGIFREDIWHLYLDVRILLGLIEKLEKDSTQRLRIINSLNQAVIAFKDDKKDANSSRNILSAELNKRASSSELKVAAVGHAHIDTGWLWPVKETIRKCARTFTTQLDLIERYPDYVFGASMPQHYQFMKDFYPSIFKRIKAAVKKGQWELQGGMWVEADCNLISGESMVRQLLYGKIFFKKEFGVNVDNLWLPDVFGYSAALPQILKQAEIDYFLTQKISWNQFNDFPHQTFNWRGIDGTEILTHFPPENTYNSELDTKFLMPAQKTFKEKDKLNEFMSLFGVGDGGGGPKPENIELGKRLKNLEGAPKVSFDHAKNFFRRLNRKKNQLETWVGELYLELHRGTLTTHGLVKKQNRKLENKLKAVEFLWSNCDLKNYPQNDLDEAWKKLMINQFHDIIPGSSINLVYKNTHKEYEGIHKTCDKLLNKSASILFKKDKNSFTLVNSLSYHFKGVVKIPHKYKGYQIISDDKISLATQQVNKDLVCFVDLEPFSFKTFSKGQKEKSKTVNHSSLVLENNYVKYEFHKDGTLKSAYDKELKLNFLGSNGNVLSLYEDRPLNWDAWDIDFYYKDSLLETSKVERIEKVRAGVVNSSLNISYTIGNSTIKQHISLSNHSKRLDFNTSVDWKEKHKMLRVHFPTTITNEQATFDIQYGHVKRNTHKNTSWDKAKFEVVGHKYADLSNNDYGVALMNDCKYGYSIFDNTIDLNLLRSPNNPDADADIGYHEFVYSFYPHNKDLIRSNVIEESTLLNHSPIIFEGYKNLSTSSTITYKGKGIEITAFKKSEYKNEIIIRTVETLGRNSEGNIYLDGEITETNLLEQKNINKPKRIKEKYFLKLKPFEIKTYKIKT
ncbi:alpha-mannosidase [bacterium]|nr:alpha-mannosidase [bacterium]